MRRHLLLPFIETIAWNAEFPSDLGRRTVAGIQKFNGLTLELRSESSSLSLSHLRGGLIVPPFEVSVKPGPAQESFLDRNTCLLTG
jgi:hypothetical protein